PCSPPPPPSSEAAPPSRPPQAAPRTSSAGKGQAELRSVAPRPLPADENRDPQTARQRRSTVHPQWTRTPISRSDHEPTPPDASGGPKSAPHNRTPLALTPASTAGAAAWRRWVPPRFGQSVTTSTEAGR